MPGYITAGPDGALWLTESTGKIGPITTDGHVTEYAIPTAPSSPQGITPGPDGTLWFADQTANFIGPITPAGQIREFPLPQRGGFNAGTFARRESWPGPTARSGSPNPSSPPVEATALGG